MRILYVLGSLQHPLVVHGGLRHYHFLRLLAARHSITVLTLADDEVPAEARAEINALAERLLVFPVTARTRARGARRIVGRVTRELRLRQARFKMRSALFDLARSERFDVVLFHGKALYPVIARCRDLPTVVDFCDATTLRQREHLRQAKGWAVPWRLAAYAAALRTERRLLAHTPHLSFISLRDREAVLGRHSQANIIPNGIDRAYWRARDGDGQWNRLVFTGVMDYAPNEDAALFLTQKILPRLQRSRPDVQLVIAGLNPTRALIETAQKNPAVTVTGYVPDLRPYLDQAALYVAPIRYASGLQNKILEALAMGIPVLTTPVVADGLRLHEQTEPPVQVAHDVEPFVAGILSLLDNVGERRRLAVEGKRFVAAHFDWARGAEALEAMCIRATAHSTRTSPGGLGVWQPV